MGERKKRKVEAGQLRQVYDEKLDYNGSIYVVLEKSDVLDHIISVSRGGEQYWRVKLFSDPGTVDDDEDGDALWNERSISYDILLSSFKD